MMKNVATTCLKVILLIWVMVYRCDAGEVVDYDHREVMQYRDAGGALRPVLTKGDWEIRRKHIVEGMEAAMGKLPDRAGLGVPEVKVIAEHKELKYTRYHIRFVVEEGDDLHAYLYVPKGIKAGERRAGMLALHPTHAIGKGVVDGQSERPNRGYGKELANRGYVVIAPDYPSFGEEKDYDFKKAFASKRYASGTMKGIFNHMRCVDLLVSRGDVDGERIGVIGHSLGGHNAMFVGVFDERLKVVVSSCGWTPFGDYYGGDLRGWTSDRYMPRLRDVYGLDPEKVPFDFYEVASAIAPRGFFTNAPLHDGNFEVNGVKKGIAAARNVYKLYDRADYLVSEYPDAGHDFPSEVRQRAYEFIDRELKLKK